MDLSEAIRLINPAITKADGTWADIGAGTGMFTMALDSILSGGEIHAVDKSPHALWRLELSGNNTLHIVEANFNRPMDLPALDGIVMANALHYSPNHRESLKNILEYLKPGGRFILVEYDTDQPRPPWVPHPIAAKTFLELSEEVGLENTSVVGETGSEYGYDRIYAAVGIKVKM